MMVGIISQVSSVPQKMGNYAILYMYSHINFCCNIIPATYSHYDLNKLSGVNLRENVCDMLHRKGNQFLHDCGISVKVFTVG